MNEMSKQDFFEYVKDYVTEHLPQNLSHTEVTLSEVFKQNDQQLTGLHFFDPDGRISPVIYLDNFYERYQSGENADNLAREVENTMSDLFDRAMPPIDVVQVAETVSDYSKVKGALSIHLCDTELNAHRLQALVHHEISDYSMTYHIQHPNMETAVAVRPIMLDSWGITAEQLQADAIATQRESQTPVLIDFNAMMMSTFHGEAAPDNLLASDAEISPPEMGVPYKMYVLTNESERYGASLLAQEDVLAQIGEKFGADYYILPSSIHEVILIPNSSDEISIDELSSMVSNANETTISADELLSGKVQYYDRASATLENAAQREARLEQEKQTQRQEPVVESAPAEPVPTTTISYDIYQVKSGSEYVDYRFTGLQLMEQFGLTFSADNYEKVYSGTVDAASKSNAEVLESLFERFNLQHPADFRGHSMSVSDVVVLHENGRDTAHFCDSIGFAEMPQFLHPEPALTATVENAVTMETSGLEVEQHYGTWHSIDSREIGGKDYFLMEHDEFGDEAACVIVDSHGELEAEDVMDGFSPEVVAMIAQQALLDKMTAEQDVLRESLLTLSAPEVLERSYEYNIREDILFGMEEWELDSRHAEALLASPTPLADVYHMYEQSETDHMDTVRSALEQQAESVLSAEPRERNYLRAAEEYTEENYDNIDGRMSTQSRLTPGDDTESQPEQQEKPQDGKRPSVLGRLKEKQAEVAARDASAPKREMPAKGNDMSID